jgi:hypothetical protein
LTFPLHPVKKEKEDGRERGGGASGRTWGRIKFISIFFTMFEGG